MEKRETSKSEMWGKLLDRFVNPIISIILALAFGAVLIVVIGNDLGAAYSALILGAFGNLTAFSETLLAATPLMFTAMAFSVAYRGGMFNIGAEGQFYAGAIMGAWAGNAITGLPPVLHISLVVLTGAAGGALLGFIAAYLKARRGVHEVITCIMLNYIAINVTNYLVSTNGPLRGGSTLPATQMIQETAKLPNLFPSTRLTGGFIIAIACAALLYIFLWKTRVGYKVRAVGLNPIAAEYGGIKSLKYAIITMALAGALAGIGGAVEISGVLNRFYGNFSSGYGFDGIAVGMLANNHPIGLLLSALLFGALKTGATAMQIQAGTNAELVKVLQAFIIFLIACKWTLRKFIRRVQEKRQASKQNHFNKVKEREEA
ncbi:MAG: ABC transporter permease [Candidatus Pelethousia sp.]|nr:ABC transporter permease [Candidatus Pelethousia sp.]